MAKGPNYRVPYRRRRQKKTDYAARRVLATSEHPRFVVRVSDSSIIVQVVKSEIEGDYVLAQASSSELKKGYGWMASGKNAPAAYLLGLLAGKKALAAGVEHVNLDMGLKKATTGNKVFAVAKGAIDAGLDIPCDSDIIPPPERINGSIIAEYAENMEDPLEYERRFSVYLRRGLRPEALTGHFEEVKARIEENKFE
ncbi:50S ribosomal protein L18 [Candidatus Bathyarchaeota archaeon]|nr:50S ribosomal protein L18 [Candidatus Bathyarchaeota archaeon]